MKEEINTDNFVASRKLLNWRKKRVLLLVLLVYIAVGLFYNSARSYWLAYEPWFGMPKEVEYYSDVGALESFELRLTQDQYMQWVERFQLKAEEGTLHWAKPVMTAIVDLGKTARVTLRKRDHSPDGDEYRLDIADYTIEGNEASVGVVKVEKSYSNDALVWCYSIVAIMTFFVLPVLVARFFVGSRIKGCFSFKELFLNLLWSWIFMGVGSFFLVVSVVLFSSCAPDHPFFLMIGTFVSGFIACGFICILLYLLTVIYRWVRSK